MQSSPVRFALALIVAMLLLAAVGSAFGAPADVTPREAIERAVVSRMGEEVSVAVEALRTDVTGQPGLRAVPDPAARASQPARFVLTADGERKGLAVATVRVETEYARATRAIARDETLTAEAIEVVTGTLEGIALRRVPSPEEIVGLEAVRAIAPGEPVTDAVVRVPPLVQSGDEVTIIVSLGRVEATGVGIASGSGYEGDVIRVISPRGRRPLRVRIVGEGAVEVVP